MLVKHHISIILSPNLFIPPYKNVRSNRIFSCSFFQWKVQIMFWLILVRAANQLAQNSAKYVHQIYWHWILYTYFTNLDQHANTQELVTKKISHPKCTQRIMGLTTNAKDLLMSELINLIVVLDKTQMLIDFVNVYDSINQGALLAIMNWISSTVNIKSNEQARPFGPYALFAQLTKP